MFKKFSRGPLPLLLLVFNACSVSSDSIHTAPTRLVAGHTVFSTAEHIRLDPDHYDYANGQL